jgi:mycothiol synthase
MADVPAGYAFREPAAADVEAVGAMLVADQLAAGFAPTLDAAFVARVWSRPDFDPRADAWIVIDDAGEVVGYGQVMREEPDAIGSWGVVHLSHRGRGIGSSLLDRIEARAGELLAGVASPMFRHSITAGDAPAEAILRERGLRPIRHFWHMQIDLAGAIEPGPAPDGIDIGAIEPLDDLTAIHGVLEAAFVDDPGDHPEPFEVWAEGHLSSPTYDPTLWLLARDGGKPVGVLIASAGDERGWVDWLAVLASHRGRGIGMALLRRSFAMFAGRGITEVLVNVDAENVTGATGVYERAGMRVVNRWDLWERWSAEAR